MAAVKSYFDNWNPDFLFLHGDSEYSTRGKYGNAFILWDLPFILIGIYFLLKKKEKENVAFIDIIFACSFAAAISNR